MEFTDKLDKLLDEKDWSKPELSNVSGVPYTTIMSFYDKEKGTDNIKLSTLKKISKALDVSLDYLTDDNILEKHLTDMVMGSIKIPVLGRIPAGIPIEAIQDIIDWEEIPKAWTSGGREYFGLKLDGDSMEPHYNNKDVVIFLKTNDCDSGKDCAVMVNGYDATFKKVRKQENGIALFPINVGKYEPKFYSNEDIEKLPVRILGVAKEIRRKVD